VYGKGAGGKRYTCCDGCDDVFDEITNVVEGSEAHEYAEEYIGLEGSIFTDCRMCIGMSICVETMRMIPLMRLQTSSRSHPDTMVWSTL